MRPFHSQRYTRVMLYLGYVLSQTQFLLSAQLYIPKSSIPYFIFSYFTISTLHLLYSLISYAFLNRQQKAHSLQLYEYIVLPISALCISLIGANEGLVQTKITACILLTMQSLLVISKIMNFSTVTVQLAQISTVIRLIRIVKLNLVAIVPLILSSFITVAILTLLQIATTALFFFKFTYQKTIYEYILFIGIFCGVVSSVECIIEAIFGLYYAFIGELLSLYLYLGENTFVQAALQIKYLNSLKRSSQSKQDDQVLAGYLFIQECLFEQQRSLNLSLNSKNQAAIHTYQHLQRAKLDHITREILYNLDSIFQMKGQDSQKIRHALFTTYIANFYQTESFNCFQFTVGKALELCKESKALILYYSFIEYRKSKMSMLQECKFAYLYSKIAKQIDQTEKDQQDIDFIFFTENLRQLKHQIQQCLTNQLNFIQFLTDKSKKGEMFADNKLTTRHKIKKQVRNRIKMCMSQGIYFSSNEFKYLYLLYQVGIQKRYYNLQLELQRYFLANQVQKLRFQSNENSLIVLSGFIHGQIINSNQVFKNYFLANSSFNKNNIAEYLPSQKQRTKHMTLMAQYVSFQLEHSSSHTNYECYLAIERELGVLKLKAIQKFTISARIYYQNSSAFNYVCCLLPNENHNYVKKKLFLTKKDCKSFMNKGIQLAVLDQVKIEQLDQCMEVCEIEFNYQSRNMLLTNHLQEDNNIEREKEIAQNNKKAQDFLQEKAVNIQRKFMNMEHHFEYTVSNILQISAILLLAILVLSLCLSIDWGVSNYSASISDLLGPINQAELAHNRILLQQEILSFNNQTSFFPDHLCASVGIQSLSAYIGYELDRDTLDVTDQFISAAYRHKYGIIGKDLYYPGFSSSPFLVNLQQKITYQKYITLMKSYKYKWLDKLKTSPLNTQFYSQIFPSLMINSTLTNPKSMNSLIAQSQQQYINSILNLISKFSAISFASILLLLLLSIALRLNDTRTIVEYLRIVQCIPTQKLTERIKEIKSSLQQLRQLESSRIESVQFQVSFAVQIVRDKETENIPMRRFTDWQINSKTENDNSIESSIEDDLQFIQKYGREKQPNIVLQSAFVKLILFNKAYLSLMLASLVAVAILTSSAFEIESKKINTLMVCKQATEQLNKIQQKMINLVAYNWLNVLSLSASIDMTAGNKMYKEAIDQLMQSEYNQKIRAAYTKEISDQILYGQVCTFFNNYTECKAYRNHIFSSGFSILNPMVIKQSMEVDKISSNPQYYISNLCDKTWLLFEGIVPMTHKIAQYGFSQMTALTNRSLTMKLIPIAVILFLVMGVSVVYQWVRYRRERMIEEEVFSMQTVDRLYSVEEYKPFFNKVYYS